jgi:hypothetical protein
VRNQICNSWFLVYHGEWLVLMLIVDAVIVVFMTFLWLLWLSWNSLCVIDPRKCKKPWIMRFTRSKEFLVQMKRVDFLSDLDWQYHLNAQVDHCCHPLIARHHTDCSVLNTFDDCVTIWYK